MSTAATVYNFLATGDFPLYRQDGIAIGDGDNASFYFKFTVIFTAAVFFIEIYLDFR